MSFDATFKLCIFGEGGVGKTTFINRYLSGLFNADTKITLGASIHTKSLNVEGKRIALQIWDFGGESQFRFLLPAYARGSSGAIFMYDITRYATLMKVDDWLSIFYQGLGSVSEEVPILIVGSKLDLKSERTNSANEAEEFTRSLNFFKYIECSAKNGENIEEIFKELVKEIMLRTGIIEKLSEPEFKPEISKPEPKPEISKPEPKPEIPKPEPKPEIELASEYSEPPKPTYSVTELKPPKSKYSASQPEPSKPKFSEDYTITDYSKIDYSLIDYSKIDYSKIDYSKIDYSKIDYSKIDYSKIDYSKIDYSKIDYSKIDYSKQDFSKFDFSKLDFSKVDFSKVDFSKPNSSQVKIESEESEESEELEGSEASKPSVFKYYRSNQ